MPAQQISIPVFIDNPAIAGRMERYMRVRLDIGRALDSWRQSLLAHEWLDAAGQIRNDAALDPTKRDKLAALRAQLQSGQALPCPVLGIGLFDNIEIGSGSELFCLLAREGYAAIDVHIPRSNEKDFKPFLGEKRTAR